ncbi:MAG: hypothetical protein ACD_48C00287G0001 [uncultured bacterium]|nr:MAG: hypothetical protein ACD_48C00287G0001 [uncultured bacterium]
MDILCQLSKKIVQSRLDRDESTINVVQKSIVIVLPVDYKI